MGRIPRISLNFDKQRIFDWFFGVLNNDAPISRHPSTSVHNKTIPSVNLNKDILPNKHLYIHQHSTCYTKTAEEVSS